MKHLALWYIFFTVSLGLVVFASRQTYAMQSAPQMATFTVNSTADAVDASPGNGVCATSGGVCTLRAAIQETNALAGIDTITVPGGTYQLTIPGTGEDESVTGDLDIRDGLIINGADPNTTFIDGGALDHVFHVRTNQAVTLTGMTIQNGNAPYIDGMFDGGGGIRATGQQLSIINCKVVNNHSIARGGGVFSIANAISITDSQISNNTSQTSGGGFSNASSSTIINVTDTIFAENNANGGAGGGDFFGNLVNISHTEFNNNTAVGWGGGVYFSRNDGSVTLDNVTLSGNSSGQYGGAGIVSGDNMNVHILNSQILNNRAASGGGGIYYSYPDGATLTIANSTFAGNQAENTATTSGGAILLAGDSVMMTITGSQFIENASTVYAGGGIANFADNSFFTISNTQFLSNTAHTHGGAFWSNGDHVVSTITDSLFTGNSSFQNGGAFYTYALTNTVTIANSHFEQNQAEWYGGAVSLSGPSPIVTLTNVTAHITDSTFMGNTALFGGGAVRSGISTSTIITNAAFINNAGSMGGALHISADGMNGFATAKVGNSTFSGNQALLSGGAIYGYSMSANLDLENVTIAYNMADSDNTGNGDGGGIFVENGATAAFANSLIATNTDQGNEAPDCAQNGGIIFSHNNNLVGKTDGCNWAAGPGDILGTIANPVEPLLAPLTGIPAAHIPNPGSPAIDAGSLAPPSNTSLPGCLVRDQQGTLRPVDGDGDGTAVCDIGAIEAPERISTVLEPDIAGMLVYTDTHGNPTTIVVPAGAVTETTTLVFTPIPSVTPPTSLLFAGHALDLEAYINGVLQPGFTFNLPISITITYADEEVNDLNEESLVLLVEEGTQWGDAACGAPETNMTNNMLTTPVCHLSRFALFGNPGEMRVYLPMVLRP